MAKFKHDNFSERATTAADAKKALLDKFRSRPSDDDPEIAAQREARRQIVEARDARQAAKDAEKRERERIETEARAEAERLETEARAAAEAAAEAERLELERTREAEKAADEAARLERAARILTDEADRKAARDARYAARKARVNR